MSDNHTDETREFNDFLVMIGNYKRFEAYEFKKDVKLKRLFDMYFFRLKDEGFDPRKFSKELRDYFKERYADNPEDAYNKVFGNEKRQMDGAAMKDFFQIKSLKLAMSIYSHEYYPLPISRDPYKKLQERANKYQKRLDERTNYHAYKKRNSEIAKSRDEKESSEKQRAQREKRELERKRIHQDVKNWHLYCLAINQAEQFIKEKYKGWGSELLETKREKINKKLEAFSEQLKILDNNTFNSMALYDISKTKKYSFKSLKFEKLLNYNLPLIDTKAKAKAITENLLPPYN